MFVPGALPGERVLAAVAADRAELIEVLAPSAERITPPCPHFGDCGGCALQQWRHAPYLAWKAEQIRLALGRERIETEILPPFAVQPGSRRRLALHARPVPGGALIGFKARRAWRLAPIEICTVADPRLVAAFPALRALAAPLFEQPKSAPTLHVTATETGGSGQYPFRAYPEPIYAYRLGRQIIDIPNPSRMPSKRQRKPSSHTVTNGGYRSGKSGGNGNSTTFSPGFRPQPGTRFPPHPCEWTYQGGLVFYNDQSGFYCRNAGAGQSDLQIVPISNDNAFDENVHVEFTKDDKGNVGASICGGAEGKSPISQKNNEQRAENYLRCPLDHPEETPPCMPVSAFQVTGKLLNLLHSATV